MKVSFVLVCTCAIVSIRKAQGSSIGAPFYPLEPEDLSDGEIKELEYLEKYYPRPKRFLVPPDPISGSAGILTHLKSAALAGTKDKIAGAVAGTVGALSIASKAGLTHVGKTVGGAALGSAGAINDLKTAALTGISAKIGQIASGSAQAAAGASGAIGLASAGAAKHIKTAVFHGIATKIASGSAQAALGLATAGSSAVGQSAKGLKGAVFGSASFLNDLKNALLAGITKHIGLVAAGSAKAATGASAGLKTKIGLISADIAAGSADAIGQLKQAVAAGTKKKLGQAASGLAGAITGAVGSASAGAGQLARGVLFESANLINNLKTAVLVETKNKIGQLASGSAGLLAAGSGALANGAKGAIVGSAGAITQAKLAALTGVAKKVASASAGAVGKASSVIGQVGVGAVKASIDTVNQVKSAAISGIATKIGQAASASAGAVGKASSVIGQVGVGAVKASIDAVNQVKSAAISGIATKIGQAASASASASGNIAKSVASASVNLKSTAIVGTKNTIGALASGSAGAILGLSAGKSKRSLGTEPVEQFIDLPKRSESAWSSGSGHGSADIINQLKSAVVTGLKKKIGQVARGSAGAIAGSSAGFSKGSFGGGEEKGYHHHVPYEPGPSHDDHKPSINVWELKKSVFNTLLQAVKAIKGGVLAIKGQLIKGSGYVVAGGGQLLASGGDKVTSLGKNIISNAVLVHPHKEHHVHSEYGHPSAGYTAPSGPPVVYDAPSHSSGPSYESHYESHYDHHNDHPPHAAHAGIVLLKKIPSPKDTYHTSHSHPDESRIPAFKPLAPTGPSFGTIAGKFFTASTSLDTAQPTHFGNTAHGTYETYKSHGESHYPIEDSHATLHPSAPPYYEQPRTKFDPVPPPSFQAPLKEHKLEPTAPHGDFSSSASGHGASLSAPATKYGASYVENQSFLNYNDHIGAESSNTNEQKVKLTKGELLDHQQSAPTLASSQITLPKDVPQSFDALKSALKINSLQKPLSSEFLTNTASLGPILSKPSPANNMESSLYFKNHGEKHSFEDLSADTYGPTYSRFKKTPSKTSFSQNLVSTKDNSLDSFLPRTKPKTPLNSKEVFDGLSSAESYQKYLEHFPFQKTHPAPSSSSTRSKSTKPKYPQKLRMQSEHDHRQRRPSSKGGYSVVESVSYEITPDGAKRLT